MDVPSSTGKPFLRPVLHGTEERVLQQLVSITNRRSWRVFPAVKLTGAIDPMPLGVTTTEWATATRQHLDFVVTDRDCMPLFAIELDGRTHRRARSVQLDRIKDKVCAAAGLDMLRISSSYLNTIGNGRTIVEYLVDAHQWASRLGRDHFVHECVPSCDVHPDAPDCVSGEVTDYRHASATLVNGRFRFPNDIVGVARETTMMANLGGHLLKWMPTSLTFERGDGWTEAWSWLPVRGTGYLFQKVEVRRHHFPSLDPCDLAMDLCWINLAHDAKRLSLGEPVILRNVDITGRFRQLAESVDVLRFDGRIEHCSIGATWIVDHHCIWPPACRQLHPESRAHGQMAKSPQISTANTHT